MAHTPYGYDIVDGRAVIDTEQAEKVQAVFKEYLSGAALLTAAENAGLNMCHTAVGKMLRNRHYLGDDFYPEIITREMFDAAEEKRMEKARGLGRIRELEKTKKPECSTLFRMPKVKKKYEDLFKQAEYVYSLIESEVEKNGGSS